MKQIRANKDMTQKEFCEVLAVSRECVSDMERDRYKPSNALIRLISMCFDVSEKWIKTGEL